MCCQKPSASPAAALAPMARGGSKNCGSAETGIGSDLEPQNLCVRSFNLQVFDSEPKVKSFTVFAFYILGSKGPTFFSTNAK